MTRPGNGDGNGRRGPAGTAVLDPAELAALTAPARLAVALLITGNDVSAAQRLLKSAGYPVSVRAGDNTEAVDGDGLFAAHPVNVPDAGWSYSANGSPGHEQCCATRRRGIYQGMRFAGDLPYVHSRVMTPEGRVFTASFVMSRTLHGPRAVITWDAIEKGRWAHRLGIPQSGSPRIREAVRTVLLALAYDDALDERPFALTPSARTPDGRIPVPEWAILPTGYGDQPDIPEPDRLAARRMQAAIAARSPNIALIIGASIAGPFAAATMCQSCLWELVAGAGAGKTTTVQFAAAMWGRPALPPEPGIVASWDASSKGMGRNSGHMGTLPVFADESGTADFAPAEWARFTYGQTQGASRMTSSMDGELRRTPGWAGFMFMSGNGSITEGVRSGKFAGIPRRVITLSGKFTLSAADCDKLAAALTADYGYVGPAVLEAVTVAQFSEWVALYRDALGVLDGPTLNTNAAQLAAAVAGARAADEVLGTGTQLADAALTAALAYLAASAEPESDRDRVLRTLAEYLSSNRFAWLTQGAYTAREFGAPLDGLQDDEWLYVYPAMWERLASDTGITTSTVLREMYEAGDLAVPDANRRKLEWMTKGPRWAGRPPCYKIRLSALADAEPADVDGQAPEPASAGPTPPPAPEPAEADPWAGEAAAMDAYRQAELPPGLPAPAISSPAPPAAPADPRTAWLDDARTRTKFTSEQQAELTRIVTLLDENPDPADKTPLPGKKGKTPLVDLTDRLQFLATMDGSREGSKGWGGPFLPTLRGRGMQLHVKRGLDAAELATIIEGYGIERDYHGPVAVLDRNGAWIGSIGNAKIACGQLDHTGEISLRDARDRAGYVKVIAHPWHEADMPNPLGHVKPGAEVVISTELAGLLYDLSQQICDCHGTARWPDDDVIDSWTSTEVTRLKDWGNLAREQRRYALETHGYGSGAYQATKDAASKAISMMAGTREMGQPRSWVCKAHRPDVRHAIITNSAVTIWRTLDRCRKLAAGNPDLVPIGIRAKDELLIPAAALELFTTQNYPGGSRPPVRLDPTGVELGTFKVKGTEARP